MVASAGLVVPLERLGSGKSGPHPAGDSAQFPELDLKLSSLLGNPLLGSALCTSEPLSWHVGKLRSLDGGPDAWPELRDPRPLDKKVPISQVLRGIRNALAHGNLYIRGKSAIEALIFVSEDRDQHDQLLGFKFVIASPNAFHALLQRWFAFLEENDVPQNAVALALERAA